jgi:hypothetical protein
MSLVLMPVDGSATELDETSIDEDISRERGKADDEEEVIAYHGRLSVSQLRNFFGHLLDG